MTLYLVMTGGGASRTSGQLADRFQMAGGHNPLLPLLPAVTKST